MGDERLADVAARLDAERFVGRADALASISSALDDVGTSGVVYVHGPAGIGKSALLREVGRRAVAVGRACFRLDGRTVAPDPSSLVDALDPFRSVPAPVVILDEVDELAAVRFELRDLVLTLPRGTVVILAGRVAPSREWFDGELGQLTRALALRPLDANEARALLIRHGVVDARRTEPLIEWAAGYPLALTLAATTHDSAAAGVADHRPIAPAEDGPLGQVILDRLAGRELDRIDPGVLDLAAIAPAVDARMLAAALPGRSTRAALAELRELSVAERVGRRTTLHRLVRSAIRAELRASDPERSRRLVLWVAEHLHARALTDEPELLFALADLIEHADLRLASGPSTTHYADRPRPGDVEALGDARGIRGTAWWHRLKMWCDDRPEFVVVVRRATGELSGMSIAGAAERFPDAVDAEIEVGPARRHARAAGHSAEALLVHGTEIVEDPAETTAYAEAMRVGNAAMIARCGIPNPRYLYVTDHTRRPGDGTEIVGYEVVEELRRHDGERELFTMVADMGPGGVAGRILSMIRSEQCGDEDLADRGVGPALVAALRSFHDDDVMAQSTLGQGTGDERAASARRAVRLAIDAAFAGSAADHVLRTAIERTYLDRDGGHAVAQEELFMSRSSFYRHLQRARDQLVARSIT